ncbi:MAG: (Fe-S)-binding protein [Polyangiaceae bacterium]|nr:(Fe-S)-binding protein [Polyangiaceae bacterium]
MSPRLPLVATHSQEHASCAHCPKLCRHSCPVSTVEARETTTPWGKMTSLHHVAHGNLELEPTYAATWYACTGCMRCRSFCAHGNEVGEALAAGRAEAVLAGVAPSGAYSIIERHAARQSRAVAAAKAIFGPSRDPSARVVYVPGCTACVLRPADALAGRDLVDALSDGPVEVAAGSCCGLPLLDAGDRDGFLSSAKRFLASLGAPDIVVLSDPGCLHALKRTAPSLGLEHDLELIHVSELAARHLGRLERLEVEGPVRYHDACKLGRGLGVYDEPREALGRVLGRAPDELHMNREVGECSGAGGQLPRVFPETSAAVTDELLGSHTNASGGMLVTACPGAAARIASRPDAPEVVELGAFLSRAIHR